MSNSFLAPLTGASFRVGREAKAEFDEEFGLDEADRRTMGSSLLIQARETDHPVAFTPPPWAYVFPDDDCFLPGLRREISPLARAATLTADYGDASDLLNDIGRECLAIRLVPLSTWGSELKENDYGSSTAHIFAFEPLVRRKAQNHLTDGTLRCEGKRQ